MSEATLINATWAVVALVVLLLVAYLSAVLIALRKAGDHLERLASSLQRVAGDTEPFENRLDTVNDALRQLEGGLASIDRHLLGALLVFRPK